MSEHEKIIKNSKWNFIGTFMSMGFSYLMLPLLLYFMSSDFLGIWYIFLGFGGIVNLFDFGFSPTFARNINYCWNGVCNLEKNGCIKDVISNPNYELMKRVIVTCKIIYFFISFSALVCLLSIGAIYILYISKDLDRTVILFAWSIYTFAVFVNLYFGYYTVFLRGIGEIAKLNKITIIARIIQWLLSFVFLMLGWGLIGVSLAYFFSGFILRTMAKHAFYQTNSIGVYLNEVQIKITLKSIKSVFIIIWYNAWRDGIVALSEYLLNQAGTMLCSLYVPLESIAMYSLSLQLISAVANLAGSIKNACLPTIQSDYVKGKFESIKYLLSFIVCMFIYLDILGNLVLYVIGIPVINVFKPNSIVSNTMFLLMVIYQFLLNIRNIYGSYFSATNRIIYAKAFLLSSLLNVVLLIAFLNIFSDKLYAIVWSQIISQCFYNVWHWAKQAHKELNLNIRNFFRIGNQKIIFYLKEIRRRL